MTLTSDTLTAVAFLAGSALGGAAAGLLLRRPVFRRLAALANATRSPVDDIVVAALRGPVVVWCAMLALYGASVFVALPASVGAAIQRTLLVLGILSVSWVLAGLSGALVRHSAGGQAGQLPTATLMTNLTRLVVLGLGILIALQTVGISITPLLTALGVGGLAVGLALQDTLSNFFAGVHILTSRQIRPGDYVQLASGEEGYVQDVTWRYTTVRQLPNNLTIVPNAKLSAAIVTNFYLPDRELAVLVPVGVSYDSDLEQVERITNAVGREVMQEVPGGVSNFDPFIRYNCFGESSIGFTVILRGREVVDQHLIRHEFIKRLHRRYRAEGIEIPFPVRTVRLTGPGEGPQSARPAPPGAP